MNTAMFAQAALRQRQKIVRNSQQEHVVESAPRTAAKANAASRNHSCIPVLGNPQKKPTAIPAGIPRPEKPADWKAPDKKYGGYVPAVIRGKPDISFLAHAASNAAQERKKKISDPNYDWKVTLVCNKPCCDFLRNPEKPVEKEEVKLKKTVTNAKKPMQFNPNQAILAGVSLKKAPAKPTGPKTETPEDQMANILKNVSLKKATGRRVKDEAVGGSTTSNEKVPPLISSVPPLISSVPPLISSVPPLVSSTVPPLVNSAPPKKKAEPKAKPIAVAPAPPPPPQPCTAVFTNTGSDPSAKGAVLYYEQTPWKELGFTEPPLAITTYPGHRWYIKVGDRVLREFIVGEGNLQQFKF